MQSDIAGAEISFIKKATEALTDKDQKEFFVKVADGLTTAIEYTDNAEKEARLINAAVRYANQLAFILFRANGLNDELAAELRELPTPEQSTEEVHKYDNARQERIDELNKAHQEIFEEQKTLDIFTAIIAGMTEEEAKQRMAEHEAQVKEMANRQ